MTIEIDKILPQHLILSKTFLFILVLSVAVLLITGFARLILGKDSSLKHALVSALGILVLYAMCVVIYTFNPAGLSRYLAPLPYVFFLDSEMTLFNFAASDFPTISVQVLSMLVLAFLVNQINSFTPDKLRPLGWLFYRFCCVGVAIFAHYLTYRAFGVLSEEFLSGPMAEYAPMILLCILVFLFSLGFIKFIIGLFLTVANPLFGGIYTFFFANKVGKNLSRAIGTTVALTAFLIVLERIGYQTLPIEATALQQYVPFCVCVTILWVIIGHKL